MVRLRIKPLPEVKDQTDIQREVEVDVVDRKSRVLLFRRRAVARISISANMLRRSELAKSSETIVDVLLQSAGEGVSQDANQILAEFPRTMQDLSQYDTIVAFDPDWRELDQTQTELLDKWVGEESGGLIVIAGPVYTDAWVQNPAMGSIRSLYPVEFNRRLALLEEARYGSQQPWPLELTARRLGSGIFVAGRQRRREPRDLGFVQRRVRVLPSSARSRAPRCMRCIPIRKRRWGIRSRFTSPGSFTAPAACSTWAAAKCGGCGQ